MTPGSSADSFDLSLGRSGRMLGRALRRRCPNCGSGRLFTLWLRPRESCPGCGLRLDRGEHDHFLGAFTINFVGAELAVALGAAVSVIVTWPEVPWGAIEYGLYGLVIVLPLVTYPFSRTLWLAVDLTFRPLEPGDLDETHDDA